MNKSIGSSFDNFLQEEGIFDEVQAKALKSVIAMKLNEYLEDEAISKSEFAKKMQTSRAAVNRLLDPENTSVTLNSVVKAANALGKSVNITLGDSR